MGGVSGCRIAGYAAIWGVVDRAGDVIRADAFGEAGEVPLLWQHRGQPVGTIGRVASDARGLWIEAEVTDPQVATLVRGGALAGLSVGYRAREVVQGGWREVRRAALIEVSLVAVAMQPAARVERVS